MELKNIKSGKTVTITVKKQTKLYVETINKTKYQFRLWTILYRDRFHKFYELNKKRVNKGRRVTYKKHVKKGLCVRCSKPSVKGIKLCTFHRARQKEYNSKR